MNFITLQEDLKHVCNALLQLHKCLNLEKQIAGCASITVEDVIVSGSKKCRVCKDSSEDVMISLFVIQFYS